METAGKMETDATGNGIDSFRDEYQELVQYGINEKVAEELVDIFKRGLLSFKELDERALDALKEFPPDGAVAVIREFSKSNLEHVSNKSAFLCGVMKTYRYKNKMGTDQIPALKKGPDEAKLNEILARTGYSLDVTTGQRKYGGPPPDSDGTPPGPGQEVFCGKIPKDIFEDELIPLFEKCGTIWDLRLMMEPMTGLSRGFCFVTFTDKQGANEAVAQLENFPIRAGKNLKCNISVANVRLFVGNIPKSRGKHEIQEEFAKFTDGLEDVIIYRSPEDLKLKRKNRGFAFLEYESHKAASLAKRKLANGRVKVWGCDLIVDWADPMEEPDEETMAKVKVLYVRNLKADVSEEELKKVYSEHCTKGGIERVKKIKDYSFVHFEHREDALDAMEKLNGVKLPGDEDGPEMWVSLAKPRSEARQMEKRKRWNEMRQLEAEHQYWAFAGGPMMAPRGGGGGFMRGGRGWGMGPPPHRGGQTGYGRGAANGAGGGGGMGPGDIPFHQDFVPGPHDGQQPAWAPRWGWGRGGGGSWGGRGGRGGGRGGGGDFSGAPAWQ